jgi:hypothetical protein
VHCKWSEKGTRYQEYENRGVGRERAIVAADPVESDGAVVGGAEALAPEPDGGKRPCERGEDGLDVAVRREDRERAVRGAEAGEAGEEATARSGDLEGRVRKRGYPLLPGAGDLGGRGGRGHGRGREDGAEARGEAAGGGEEWGWRGHDGGHRIRRL